MVKHVDVISYCRSDSPFGDEEPVIGFVHRVARAEARGGVATLVIEAIEVDGDNVRATIATYDGPLCSVG